MEFKFCPKCGGHLEKKEWEDDVKLPVCTECGFRFYENSKPCVVAIILDRENYQVLLSRRAIKPQKGDWDMPGGFLRNGEDPVEGIHREIKEELGVKCTVEDLFTIVVDTYGDYDVYTFNVCYIVSITSGELTPMDDVDEVKWFRLDDIPDNIAFQSLKNVLKKVRENVF